MSTMFRLPRNFKPKEGDIYEFCTVVEFQVELFFFYSQQMEYIVEMLGERTEQWLL